MSEDLEGHQTCFMPTEDLSSCQIDPELGCHIEKAFLFINRDTGGTVIAYRELGGDTTPFEPTMTDQGNIVEPMPGIFNVGGIPLDTQTTIVGTNNGEPELTYELVVTFNSDGTVTIHSFGESN